MMRRILRGAKCAKPKQPWATGGPSFAKRRQITVKSSEKRLKCKIEPRCDIKSLRVRKELESNIVARRGLMIAKTPAENDFFRF